MPYEFKTTRRIEFAETDMAGIVHFASFFRYMEETEHAFYRSLGFSVHHRTPDGFVGWPRVQAGCDFRHPVRFEDEVEVHLLVRRREPKSIEYQFVFRVQREGGDIDVASGTMKVVCAARSSKQPELHAVTIPPQIAEKIEVAPPELLDALGT